jgi:RNA polymerase sigma-70 factor (ECF subfamily)
MVDEDDDTNQDSKWDDKSFGEFYKEYRVRTMYFAYRLTHNLPEAEDIVAACFEKLWLRKDRFKTSADLAAFLYIMVRNAAYDYLKLISHQKSNIDPESAEAYHQQSFEEAPHFEIIRTEILHEIFEEINNLSPQVQSVAKLSLIKGLSAKEVAETLGMAEQTVKNNKSIAVKTLRTQLIIKRIFPFLVLLSSPFDPKQ